MSATSFKIFQNDEADLWNRFVDSTPYSTILQFWQWGEVKRSEGWEPFRLGIEIDGQLKIAAQCLLKPAPFLGSYLYVPYGPIFQHLNDLKTFLPEFLIGLKEFALQRNSFVIEFDPLIGQLVEAEMSPEALSPYLDPEVKHVLLSNGFQISKRNVQPKHKLFYDLTKSDDELLMLMKKNTRYNVRLAQKKGVKINKYDFSSQEIFTKIDQFYALLLETRERAKGYPIRPKSTFTQLIDVFKDSTELELFEAIFENDLLTMNISEFTNYWSSSFYGASNRLHPDVKGAYLLRWESVLEAKRRGCKVYDFWGVIMDSKQHQGYSETKLSFGGVRMDTYGIFALPLDSLKYLAWDKLLPLRSRLRKIL
jgi:peptidoglycan pentaglycine glycine transferase (the first glycine)